jgi:pilus assembly protein Flp/PilA
MNPDRRCPRVPAVRASDDVSFKQPLLAESKGGEAAMVLGELRRRWKTLMDQTGQGLAEYALILGLIAIVSIVALIFLGSQISDKLSVIGNAV